MSRRAPRGAPAALAIACGSAAAPPAVAQDDADAGWGPPVRVTFHWENDGTLPRPGGTDRYYTNGLKLDLAWRPAWALELLDDAPFSEGFGPDLRAAFGLSVSHLIFTPEDLAREDLIEDDRPYAGWLSFAAYLQRAGQLSPRVAVFDHAELDVGVVGQNSGAEALQKAVHAAWFDEQRPNGWENQLKNEPSINLTYRLKWRFSTLDRLTFDGSPDADPGSNPFEFQAIPEIGGTVGTVYRRAEAGLTARFGWNLPDDFGATRLEDVNSATGDWHAPWGFYLFGRVTGRYVQHNLFLDGNTWRDSHSVDREPWVAEAQFGGVLLLFGGLEVGYSQTVRSEEFDGQNGRHQFGAWTIGWRTTF